ncbi:hypothetical protein QQF64_026144 [Cirrhinus molitorella]|uniref:MHC class I-like antigen recognition-like domain-containing protein n=1 Tax=Cirrhinus molitorella TaxID=172907 RepID=A0ABR3NS96_9TELE
MGLLDGRQIDYYNSKDQRLISKQKWMQENMPEDYWEIGTLSRKSKEQWFHKNIGILIEPMRRNESDLHVLQMITGCEVTQQGDKVKFSGGFREYGYDGKGFLSFDITSSRWLAPVYEALSTKREWDDMTAQNWKLKAYIEIVCVSLLEIFIEYADAELRNAWGVNVFVGL